MPFCFLNFQSDDVLHLPSILPVHSFHLQNSIVSTGRIHLIFPAYLPAFPHFHSQKGIWSRHSYSDVWSFRSEHWYNSHSDHPDPHIPHDTFLSLLPPDLFHSLFHRLSLSLSRHLSRHLSPSLSHPLSRHPSPDLFHPLSRHPSPSLSRHLFHHPSPELSRHLSYRLSLYLPPNLFCPLFLPLLPDPFHYLWRCLCPCQILSYCLFLYFLLL